MLKPQARKKGGLIAGFLHFSRDSLLLAFFWFGPWALLGVILSAALIVYCFSEMGKRRSRLSNNNKDYQKFYDIMGLDMAAVFLKYLIKLWHGIEFRGFQNIPSQGGALIVWFHGPLPTDYLALVAEVQYQYGKNVKSIMDRSLKENVPYSNFFIEKLGCLCEGREYCVNLLKEGNLVGVSPGGSRECLFGEDYSVSWGRRVGFAQVAIDAKVPIIPVFTENIREAYSTMSSMQFVWRYIYEATKSTFFPLWGGYPIKLITHIGSPIYPAEQDTAELLRDKAKRAIEDLMDEHQKTPSVTRSLLQRFGNNKPGDENRREQQLV